MRFDRRRLMDPLVAFEVRKMVSTFSYYDDGYIYIFFDLITRYKEKM